MLHSLIIAATTLLSSWLYAPENTPGQIPADSVWQSVTVPHDWAISTPFDRSHDLQETTIVQNGEQASSCKTGRTGGLDWMGAAWYVCQDLPSYRPDMPEQALWTLYIDGAMSHARVYVNGHEAGYWPYGYSAFTVDMTPYLHSGDSNTLAIRLENLPQSSRWYPGAGLYRRIELIKSPREDHIPVWGVQVHTSLTARGTANVSMDIQVDNPQSNTTYQTIIRAYRQDKILARSQGLSPSFTIRHPKLWSPETPHLYEAVITSYNPQTGISQQQTVRFGIRTISYTPEQGFRLNNQPRKFQGVCLHHDLGPLGIAVYRDAIRHQLTMLKDMGCDAIRTTHNMPCSDLVELCEEMGFMLIIEPFDVWRHAKIPNDYSVHFDEWAERDITNMILHFRNSPAVVMWSTGNEVWDQNLPSGIETARRLQELCHRLDSTRPVTCGMDQLPQVLYNGFASIIDIPGFNYRTCRYQEAHDTLPQGLILGSETASTVSSRGSYHLPVLISPDAIHPDRQSSSYDVEYCSWSGLPEQDFRLMDDYPWTIGQFVWTGFDYLGEPSPYDTDAWPAHSSYFGLIDLASLPKDRYYLYRSQWNHTSPTLHILPHWTWPDSLIGTEIPVFVYTSYPEAELFVNGVSQGRLRKGESEAPKVADFDIASWGCAPQPELLPRYRLMWQHVRYEKGELRVVAYDEQGQPVEEQVVCTTAEPYQLKVEVANAGEATEEGLLYLTLSVVDSLGRLCPDADHLIRMNTVDTKAFLGAANGDPTCLDPMTRPEMHAFHGQCTFIVRSPNAPLHFTADGLEGCIYPLNRSKSNRNMTITMNN